MKIRQRYFSLFFICSLANCNVYSQDIVIPKNIVEYKINDQKILNKCSFKSIYSQIREINETVNFFLDEPLSWYTSIQNIKIKGNKIYINLIQKVELPEFQSNIKLKEFFINYSDVSNRIEEENCLSNHKPIRELNLEKKYATGKSKFFNRYRDENIVIEGFENAIQATISEKKLKNNQTIEIDLLEQIKSSKKPYQIMNLIIKCVTCSFKNKELPDELDLPINQVSVNADFRFIKNQIDNGVFE